MGGVRTLLIAFVQIQLRIELRLTSEQLLEPILMLARAISLRLEIRKLFLCPGDAGLRLRGKSVQGSEGMLHTLDRPDQIRRVEIRSVSRSTADK